MDQLVVQLISQLKSSNGPEYVLTHQVVQFHVNPKAHTDIDGGTQTPVSAIKPGAPILVIANGIDSYLIAEQISIFPNTEAAGWKIVNNK